MKKFESISEKDSLVEVRESLPEKLQELFPKEEWSYYEATNKMHCSDTETGGSKFYSAEKGGVDNILQVMQKYGEDKLIKKLEEREDDREALLKVGAPQDAFLPATKVEGMPEGLPEALYYKVDGIKGKLKIIKLSDLSPNTKVKVLQEKENTPLSYLAVLEDNLEPEVDFATIIIGRDPKTQKEQVWTIHPGAPIKPAVLEIFSDGDEVTVQDLLDAGLKADDYIKIY